LADAYPIAVNGMDLNWSADGYHKVTVTFAYTSWRDNSLETLAMDFLENTIADSLFRSTPELRTAAEIQASIDLGDFRG